MALGSVTRDLCEYIVEEDKASSDPTRFWILPMTVRDVMENTTRLQKTTEIKRGLTEVNDTKLYRVTLQDWVKVVKRVDNFLIFDNTIVKDVRGLEEDLFTKYSSKYPEKVESVNSRQVVRLVSAETEEELMDIMRMMRAADRAEVLEFAQTVSSVEAAEKN